MVKRATRAQLASKRVALFFKSKLAFIDNALKCFEVSLDAISDGTIPAREGAHDPVPAFRRRTQS
jgi:hypothetical protein